MVRGASISAGSGAPLASTVGPLFWIEESDAGVRCSPDPGKPVTLVVPFGLAPLEFGDPNGAVIMLGLPSANWESQPLAPSSAATPATDTLQSDVGTPSLGRSAPPGCGAVAGRTKETRGVLL